MIVTTSWDDGDDLDGRVADLLDRTDYANILHYPQPPAEPADDCTHSGDCGSS